MSQIDVNSHYTEMGAGRMRKLSYQTRQGYDIFTLFQTAPFGGIVLNFSTSNFIYLFIFYYSWARDMLNTKYPHSHKLTVWFNGALNHRIDLEYYDGVFPGQEGLKV